MREIEKGNFSLNVENGYGNDCLEGNRGRPRATVEIIFVKLIAVANTVKVNKKIERQ